MVTQVERSPRLLRSRLAGTLVEPVSVCRVSERSRPEGVGTPTASSTRSSTPSFAWSVRAPKQERAPACGAATPCPTGRGATGGTEPASRTRRLRWRSFRRRSRSRTSSRACRRRGRPGLPSRAPPRSSAASRAATPAVDLAANVGVEVERLSLDARSQAHTTSRQPPAPSAPRSARCAASRSRRRPRGRSRAGRRSRPA